MDPDQQRIEEDLRGLLKGDVRCDDLFTQLYASDASIYELRPLGVVRPRSLDDVVAAVRYAAENHLPIHARGAGTGLAGESLGRGLVIDFSRYLRRIVADDGERVRVQAGVVHASLNRYLARKRPALRARSRYATSDHDGQRRRDRRRRQSLAALRLRTPACRGAANCDGRRRSAPRRPAFDHRRTEHRRATERMRRTICSTSSAPLRGSSSAIPRSSTSIDHTAWSIAVATSSMTS